MPLFYLKYKINENARVDCMTHFGSMTLDDDLMDMGPDVKLIGRWNCVGDSSGFCICEASSANVLNKWLLNWVPMVTIDASPMVDDNQARAIILKSSPSFEFDYSNVASPGVDGASLYFIEYKFFPEKRQAGYEHFANMSRDQDESDAGKNTCLGRWHNLGNGSGVAVCSSKSEVDLYSWAFNWNSMCDVKFTPVVSDDECRRNILSTKWYTSKQVPRRSWFSR